jgi:hypothetical protein
MTSLSLTASPLYSHDLRAPLVGESMSKHHLQALENSLSRRGWCLIAVHPGDEYRISATWEIQRSSHSPKLFIDFDGFGPEGDVCLPIEECYGCHLRGRESIGLYFRRVNRSSRIWEQELTNFVEALDDNGGLGGQSAVNGTEHD